ncbi:MAG TPA: DUF1569 domain-containing protein [Bacteroidota bacterium]|nr:DUF1569 domain-containing protein [Bacteroidota bacterium]
MEAAIDISEEKHRDNSETTVKSLFNPIDNAEMLARIDRLTAEMKPQWGKMNAAQMLAHAQAPLKVAFGESRLPRSLFGLLFGRIAKRKLSGSEPWQHGMPTEKSFVVSDERDFEEEKKKLVSLVKRFAGSGQRVIVNNLHPFFGRLTADEWDRLMWNHLDHHLTQFGS